MPAFIPVLHTKIIIYHIFDLARAVSAAAVATDCERPPPVPNASVNLVDDADTDTENLVSAVYACAAGYRLLGEAELFCDLDTDEWQGEPPTCRAGNYMCLAASR